MSSSGLFLKRSLFPWVSSLPYLCVVEQEKTSYCYISLKQGTLRILTWMNRTSILICGSGWHSMVLQSDWDTMQSVSWTGWYWSCSRPLPTLGHKTIIWDSVLCHAKILIILYLLLVMCEHLEMFRGVVYL